MNDEIQTDRAVNLAVYICLLGLTALTLGAGLLHPGGRLLAVAVAIIIASMKASLIAFYYMGLRRERTMVWVILGIAVLAVFILLIGIYPDMTFQRF